MYFEIVPNSALELALWLESDRMGYMLPTVTYDAFLNQQQVVQNEKDRIMIIDHTGKQVLLSANYFIRKVIHIIGQQLAHLKIYKMLP